MHLLMKEFDCLMVTCAVKIQLLALSVSSLSLSAPSLSVPPTPMSLCARGLAC